MLFAPLWNIRVPKICDKIIQNKELISDIQTHPRTHWVVNTEENCYTSISRNRKFCFLAGFAKWDRTDVIDDLISCSTGDKVSR